MKSLAIQVVGWAFLGLGFVGLFLPVLQGILFIMIGLAILSTEYAWAHRWLTKLKEKFPALDREFHRWKTRLARFFRNTAQQPQAGASTAKDAAGAKEKQNRKS